MKRDIIKIDEELCNGCGQCVPACHECALQVIDGKVRLVSELMCDGLGDCIGNCPEGAITIETREAGSYRDHPHNGGGCPGSRPVMIDKADKPGTLTVTDQPSELKHWPVQMHLINPNSPCFWGADLLLAADCVAFSTGNFHSRYLKGKSLAIACPKLDQNTDIYVEKLIAMIDEAKVNTITVMMMEVPCCGGLLQMVKTAASAASGKVRVKQIITGISGMILREDWL